MLVLRRASKRERHLEPDDCGVINGGGGVVGRIYKGTGGIPVD